jgi:hypothetical protein
MKTAFKNFPTVTLPETTPDPIGFFEAIALAGLEKQYVRIPAATQRRHFGNVPFGRLGVRVENGVCRTIKAQDFGRDFDTAEAFWSMADNAWRSTHSAELLSSFPKA